MTRARTARRRAPGANRARIWGAAGAAFCLGACASTPEVRAAAPPPVRYHVSIPEPHTQYLHVEVRIPAAPGRRLTVAMPAWIPGSYKIRDFARHVYDFTATTPSGADLATRRVDKQTWQIDHGGADVVLRYRVFAAEDSVRTSHVDDRHASINGPSVFVYAPNLRQRPCELSLDLPPQWHAYGALPRRGPLAFHAADYDALVDAPLELGTPAVQSFEVAGTRFDYVLRGGDEAHVDLARLADDARRVVDVLARDMGGLPMPYYVFLTAVTQQGGGGLEHDDSTMLMLRRDSFLQPTGYLQAAELAAHEFFHAWNVRRLRDRALRPYDYRRENHTELLWFHEGFTEAVEKLAILRAGLRTPQAFLDDLARAWTEYVALPGRNYVPIHELSRDAWIRAYQPAPNHANVAVSYYDKGKFIGLALDLELRLRSAAHGRHGELMGVFRRLMASHGDAGRGITHADIVHATSEEAGDDMAWFFDRYVHGTEEIPWPELVARFGVETKTRSPAEPAEANPAAEFEAKLQRIHAGLELRGNVVTNVRPGSVAAAAGLMLGDEIVAVDGLRSTDPRALQYNLASKNPGETVQLHVFRDARLVAVSLTLAENPLRIHVFKLRPEAQLAPAELALRKRWLRSEAPT